jgi:hypothetical protein
MLKEERMATWRRSNRPSNDEARLGVSRRRFLRAAGVGTAGAVVVGGTVAAQAGAEPAGLAAAVPRQHRARTLSPQSGGGTAAVQAVSGPLSLHTISPRRYVDTRYDGGGPFPPQGATGDAWIWDFGIPDFFPSTEPANEVPPNAVAVAFNLTAVSGKSAGNLRAFPANLTTIPRVSNVNWATGQVVANFAIVAAATGGTDVVAVAFHNASAGSVHAIVDIFGYFV